MKSKAAVLTAFSADFRSVFPADARVSAMPDGWDIAGGDSAGWGRGLAGLVWIESLGGVIFSDTGHRRRISWVPGQDPQLVTGSAAAFTGATIDRRGRLVSGDWAQRCLIVEQEGTEAEVLTDRHQDKRFNRPTDICNGPAGALFFIDQKQPFPRLLDADTAATSGVYRLDADGRVENLGIGLPFPGGLHYDEPRARLIVTEPHEQKVHAFPVSPDGRVDAGAGSVLATLEGMGKGAPHGLAVDDQGRIFTGGPGGVWVLSADGSPLGVLHLTASRVTSLAIGGGKLFIASPVGVGVIELADQTSADTARGAAPAILRQPLGFRQSIERHDPALDRIIAPDAVIANYGMGGFFEDLGGAENEIYSRSLEGLYWDSGQRCMMFSDIGNNRRLKLSPETGAISVANQPTSFTNGATLDADGNILSCEHSDRRISRTLPDGQRVTVVDRTNDGRRLNHCNDIVIRSDGNIYFTDPWWDFGAGETSDIGEPTCWHLSPNGTMTQLGGDWVACNGLALSADEKVLFINDTIRKYIRAFDVAPDGTVDNASDRIFCELPGNEDGKPDGMKVDEAGNVYCGGPGGLWVFDPAGKHLGTIRHGACQTNNLCFGGDDWRTLFLCSWTTLHSVPLLVPGVRTLDARK